MVTVCVCVYVCTHVCIRKRERWWGEMGEGRPPGMEKGWVWQDCSDRKEAVYIIVPYIGHQITSGPGQLCGLLTEIKKVYAMMHERVQTISKSGPHNL